MQVNKSFNILKYEKQKYTKDFSWGFYCINNIQQAIRWANRGAGDPVINYYEYEPNESLKNIKISRNVR